MGYITSTCVEIVHQESLNPEWEQKAFKKIIGEARMDAEPLSCNQGLDSADFNDYNGRAVETIIEMSKKYPSLLLEIRGSGEDNDDHWIKRVRNGKTEHVSAQIVYPVFNELLTAQERKAACWKAFRRPKTDKNNLYDRRVAKALRLLRDLEKNPPKCNLVSDRLHTRRVEIALATDLLEAIKRKMR